MELIKKLDLPWLSLRDIQKSKFISSMYIWLIIVPIAAKLLSKINNELVFTAFDQEIHIVLSLPFSWQAFFFCSLCFSFANTVVLVFCPKVIKEHLSFSGFRGDGKSDNQLEEYFNQEEIKFHRYVKPQGVDLSVGEKQHEQKLSMDFWRIYKISNQSRGFTRRTSIAFYSAGFLFFSYVLITNAYWVFCQILKNFCS